MGVARNVSYVSIAFVYVNLLGYVFHFFVSRYLGPVYYGEFMVLYSLMLTVGNLSGIVSVATAQTVIENHPYENGILAHARRLTFGFSTMLLVAGIAISPFLKSLLDVSNSWYVSIVAFVWFFMFIVACERGYLQALEHFGKYAVSTSLELTVRLLSAVFLLYIGLSIAGAILSSVVGLIATLVYLIFVNGGIRAKPVGFPLTDFLKVALYISPAGFLIYADSLFIRRIFDPHTAGVFASVAVLGKAVIWFCVSLFGVLFPRMVRIKDNMVNFRRFSMWALIWITLFYLVVEVGIFLFGKEVFLLLFGSKFESGFSYLAPYVASTYPLSLDILLINAFTALRANLPFIYAHLFVYYAMLLGFAVTRAVSLTGYMVLCALLNLLFLLVYLFLLSGKKD